MSKGAYMHAASYQGCRNALMSDDVQTGMTLGAAAKKYGISRERVRQIWSKVVAQQQYAQDRYGSGIDDNPAAPSTPEEAALMNKAASYYDSRG